MCRENGEGAQQSYCDSNFLSLSSLRMSGEARVSGCGRGCDLVMRLFANLQDQLKQLLISASFPEGILQLYYGQRS